VSREALQLAVTTIEAIDDLQQDLVLVHKVIHQGFELFFGLDVQLVFVLRPQAVTIREAVERHQHH
jgi:hypothetical protein